MRVLFKIILVITTVILTSLALYSYNHKTSKNIVIPTAQQVSKMNAGVYPLYRWIIRANLKMTEQHERYIVVFKDSASDAEIKNYAQEVESGGEYAKV